MFLNVEPHSQNVEFSRKTTNSLNTQIINYLAKNKTPLQKWLCRGIVEFFRVANYRKLYVPKRFADRVDWLAEPLRGGCMY